MFSSALSLDTRSRGAALIGAGLAIVLLAQLASGVPVATAMALIGWGALLAVRSESMALVNLAVYTVLVFFTVASQTHAALNSVAGQLSLFTTVDHLAALLLLAVLAWFALRRVFSFSA